MSSSDERTARDHRAMQLTPQHPSYYRSRGLPPAEAERSAEAMRQTNTERALEKVTSVASADPAAKARAKR